MHKAAIHVFAAVLLAFLSSAAAAGAFPERAIKVVTPFPAGGATDILTRILAEHMSRSLDQPMIVENRPGAATTIGASYAAREKPDGYTILMATNSTLVTNRFLYKDLQYDPDSFEPIGMAGIGPLILLANKKHGFKNTAGLVDYAKEHPGELTVASFGSGTSSHLAAEYFERVAGIKMLHVPFRGSTQVLPGLINGDIDVFFDMVATGMPQVNSGKVDVFAITSRKPLTSLPNLSTLAAQGYNDFEMTAWFSLVAPQNTPPNAISTLQKALQAALQDKDVRKRMLDMGIEPGDGSAEALEYQIRTEIPKIDAIVKQANIVVQ